MAKMGRPTKYSKELADRICKAIATSTNGIKKICNANPDFPCQDTVHEWRFEYSYFSEQYDKSKRMQAELLAEEITEIADCEDNDFYTSDKGLVANPCKVARDRLRMDARKWIACKLLPKVYGDKQEVQVKGVSQAEIVKSLKKKKNRDR